MLIGYIISFSLGLLTGMSTGLIPGLHINLIGVILLSLNLQNKIASTHLLVYIVTLAITHTFLDFIPSIYLGAPSEDTVLTTLVGHKFLLKGKGHAAVDLTNKGSILAIFSLIILYPLLYFIIPKSYTFIEKIIPLILLWVIMLMVFSEKNSRKNTLFIIILSGFLGITTMNSSINQPLLPLLTGLFSTSTLLLTIKNKTALPTQKLGIFHIQKKELIKPALLTMFVSPIFSLLPGLGSSQAAIISQKLIKEKSKKQHLILLGSINTIVIAVSFLVLYLINKARTGIADTVKQIIPLSFNELIIIFITILFTGIISFFLTRFISKNVAKNIRRINYTKISFIVIVLTTLIILLVSGFGGIIILLASTALGILCQELSQKKSILMSSIMIPTICYLI